ncbi:hypothetical protein GSU68_05160 [Rathayibacter sp. VKM Ac-2759]|uniref:hypothetical protein n=1 Tax=Rathayibacter sp. VKM Ac-2759 TaxID=2609252 RepID=UPI001316B695|nr:hypothetical protein [Rathayibacter sp. VKM Ac-2759]QHC66030.1 hypothetical protein GSU68_05160 [Rathayibacter sp. VKM Ac-2759]
MLDRTRALLASSLLVAVLALTACAAQPADVPDDAAPTTGTSVPRATVGPTGGVVLEGDDLTQRITLCLARYGLGERPSLPAETASADEQMSAQQEIDAYDATLTNCTAEAMGTTVPTTTPSS